METGAMEYSKRLTKCDGFTLDKIFKNFRDRIKNMTVRDDDIWVCTFPKSGKRVSLNFKQRTHDNCTLPIKMD